MKKSKKAKAEFSGKVAVVTGAGSGLGEAIAIGLYENGASVVLADINAGDARKVAKKLDSSGKRTHVVETDVSDHEAVKRMVEETVKRFGALHLAVNNAGFTGPLKTKTADYEIDWWNRVISTDLGGVFFGMKYEIPQIIKSGGGAIVNMSSGAGVVGMAGEPSYVAAKHGIIGLTKAAALEYAGDNIRVTAVAPGYIATPDIKNAPKKDRAALAALHPLGRLGKPSEVAELVCFLLSDRAAFITGSCHSIDGGYTAG